MLKRYMLLVAVLILFTLAGCTNEYKHTLADGRQAYSEQNYELATVLFEKAILLKPNEQEAQFLLKMAEEKLEEEKLKAELVYYIEKLLVIHMAFIEVIGVAKTQEDLDRLHEIKVAANFTPPKAIFEIHSHYVKWINQMYNSSKLYVTGSENQDLEMIKSASNELLKADEHFSNYKHQFVYFLEEKNISKSEVSFPW